MNRIWERLSGYWPWFAIAMSLLVWMEVCDSPRPAGLLAYPAIALLVFALSRVTHLGWLRWLMIAGGAAFLAWYATVDTYLRYVEENDGYTIGTHAFWTDRVQTVEIFRPQLVIRGGYSGDPLVQHGHWQTKMRWTGEVKHQYYWYGEPVTQAEWRLREFQQRQRR